MYSLVLKCFCCTSLKYKQVNIYKYLYFITVHIINYYANTMTILNFDISPKVQYPLSVHTRRQHCYFSSYTTQGIADMNLCKQTMHKMNSGQGLPKYYSHKQDMLFILMDIIFITGKLLMLKHYSI